MHGSENVKFKNFLCKDLIYVENKIVFYTGFHFKCLYFYAFFLKPTITETIRLHRLRRFGHVQRMEENRIPKRLLYSSAYFRSSAMCQPHHIQFQNDCQFQPVKSVTRQKLKRVCDEINISNANISSSSIQHTSSRFRGNASTI
jgi:hypothetical protein